MLDRVTSPWYGLLHLTGLVPHNWKSSSCVVVLPIVLVTAFMLQSILILRQWYVKLLALIYFTGMDVSPVISSAQSAMHWST